MVGDDAQDNADKVRVEEPTSTHSAADRNNDTARDDYLVDRITRVRSSIRLNNVVAFLSVLIVPILLLYVSVDSRLSYKLREPLLTGGLLCSILVLLMVASFNYLRWGKLIVKEASIPIMIRDSTDALDHLSARNTAPHQSVEDKTASRELINERLSLTRDRLLRETSVATRRGYLNLLIGASVTFVAVAVLGYSVFIASQPSGDHWSYVGFLAARLSVAVFLQVFAYFFLRLYKAGLDDLRYYQNELTNIEARDAAMHIAEDKSDAALLKAVVTDPSKTERNALLKKGETTIEIEAGKLKKNDIVELLREAMKMPANSGKSD